MRTFVWLSMIVLTSLVALAANSRADEPKDAPESWTSDFSIEKNDLASTGRNLYFVLEPGYQLILEGGHERLVITVLDETKWVDGIETRIVEERETKNDELVEVSRNYFAISKRTNSVFYFGEDVDIYKAGKVADHEGAWASGVDGAKFGLMMPGQVLLKGRYCQEIAPSVARDRAEIVSMSETMPTPVGEFKNCLKVEETTPLEPDNREHKHYAPGIGLVQDGSLRLIKYGRANHDSKPPAQELTESQKIEKLIQLIATMEGATFIRNSAEHTSKEAAEHLRSKWKAAGKRISTAQQFVEEIASRSSTTNEPYHIRLADGSMVLAGDLLIERLREIEKGG